jgi:hypothetical protein
VRKLGGQGEIWPRSFQPECAPPMTVAFTNVTVTDTANNISANLTGTF